MLTVIAAVLAIAGTVLAFIFILPENKRAQLPAFFKWLHDALHFKVLFTDVLLKALYIATTLYTVFSGIFMLFEKNVWGQSKAVAGLLLLFVGPFAVRLVYELLMMFVLLLKNVMRIRHSLSFEEPDDGVEFKTDWQEVLETAPDVVEPIQPIHSCPTCGDMADDTQSFCGSCGTKLSE